MNTPQYAWTRALFTWTFTSHIYCRKCLLKSCTVCKSKLKSPYYKYKLLAVSYGVSSTSLSCRVQDIPILVSDITAGLHIRGLAACRTSLARGQEAFALKPTSLLVHISEHILAKIKDAHLRSFVFPAVSRPPWQNHALRMYMTTSGAQRYHWDVIRQVRVAYSCCMTSGLRSALGPSSTLSVIWIAALKVQLHSPTNKILEQLNSLYW